MIDEHVLPPEQALEFIPAGWDNNITGLGTGWGYEERLNIAVSHKVVETFPHAADIATLGAVMLKQGLGVPADQALPVYLRDNVALKKSER